MRLVIAIIAGAVLTGAVPALAADGSGGPTVEIAAVGVSQTPADVIVLGASFFETGDRAKAEADRSARMLRLKKALIGIAKPDGVQMRIADGKFGFAGNEQYGDDAVTQLAEAAPADPVIAMQRISIITNIDVIVADISQVEPARKVLQAEGADNIRGPILSLNDTTTARHLAQRDALAVAKVDAANYANALGLQVGQILEVSEVGNTEAGAQWAVEEVLGAMGRPDASTQRGEVKTQVAVRVKFALKR